MRTRLNQVVAFAAALTASATASSPVLSADLPPAPLAPVYQQPLPPENVFEGWYLGGTIGGATVSYDFSPASGSIDSSGVLGGVIGGMGGAPPPPKPKLTGPLKVGGNVQAARILNRVQPVYPPLARQTRISGTVRLHAIISKDGSIQQLEVISGHPLLQQNALDAVRQWRYQPTLLNGEPVEVDTTIDVIFSLNQ
jgi:protein TonB